MGNLAANVMSNVRLGDTVSGASTNPSHKAAEITKQVTIERGESTTGEGELAGVVVGEKGVSVLEERDQDEPVVNPEVRGEVDTESVEEAEVVDSSTDSSHPDNHTNVGHNNLHKVVGREQAVGIGVEVCKIYTC